MERVIAIADDCLECTWPDLTVVLDVDLKTAAARLKKDLDRMEQKGDNYHQKVREGFLKLAEMQKSFVVIDATADIESVHKQVVDTILSMSF